MQIAAARQNGGVIVTQTAEWNETESTAAASVPGMTEQTVRDESETADGTRRTQLDDVERQTETVSQLDVQLYEGLTTVRVAHGIPHPPETTAGGRAGANSADVSDVTHDEEPSKVSLCD